MTAGAHIAVLAKAPIAGLAKTRLIPALGAAGAARLQRALTLRALHTAQHAALGAVTLWCAPDTQHRFFRALQRGTGVALRAQPGGDLGARMHAAFVAHTAPEASSDADSDADSDVDSDANGAARDAAHDAAHIAKNSPADSAANRAMNTAEARPPLLLIGTDCPALTGEHLHAAALALHDGADAVTLPAEDGGYVLVGLRAPQPALFEGMRWSTEHVMADTRQRARAAGLRLHEGPTLWDVDRPEDLARLRGLRWQV